MKTIVYTPQALASLKSIASYYKNKAGIQVAKKIVSQIRSSIDDLSVLPERYPCSHFSKNVRKLPVKKLPYTVYYSIEKFDIVILEILHQRRDHSFLSSS